MAAGLVLLASCDRGLPKLPGYQGVVEYDERVVAFEVGGRIEEVAIRRGDEVQDGQVLARLDDSLERLTLGARQSDVTVSTADLVLLEAGSRKEDIATVAAQVRSAKAAEALAKSTLARVQKLYDASALTQVELDKAQSDADRAVAERQALEQKLALLQHGARPEEIERAKARVIATESTAKLEAERLAKYVVREKGPGTILDVHVEPGELAIAGTPLATVADTLHPYVDVFVPQQGIEGIQVGSKATVRVDTALTLPGTVEYVSRRTEFSPRFLFSERERQNLVIRVRVRIEDPSARLHSGVPAFVTIERR
jgi:HlyD family secretion protein